MNLLSRLRSEGVLLLHHDYRNGSYQDLSGNGKHGTPTVCELRKGALRFSSATGAEVDAGTDTIGTGAGSVVVHCLSRGGGESGGGRLFDNGAFALYTSATGQLSYGFGTIRPGSAGGLSIGTDHVVVASWDAAGIANLYIDGSLDDGPGTIGAPSGGTDMTVGNRPALDRQFHGEIYSVGAINRELTPAEITELTAEVRASKPDVRQIITTVDSAGDRYSQCLGNGARVIANVAPGSQVPGTPFYVDSGAFAVEVEEVNGKPSKVLTCTNDGLVYAKWGDLRNNLSEAAYGTWEWWDYKDNAADLFVTCFCASEPVAYNDAAIDGYFLWNNTSSRDGLNEVSSGVRSILGGTAISFNAPATWYKRKITRSPAGLWTFYRDDVLVDTTGGSGSNPVTDTTHTTGKYITFEVRAGNKIALATLQGEPLFKKYYGVI